MFKSECMEAYSKAPVEITKYSCTKLRSESNLNQYLYLDYMYLKGKLVRRRLSKKHISVGVTSAKVLHDSITSPKHKLLCVNDVQLSEERYNELRSALLKAFELRFPQKSKFEL